MFGIFCNVMMFRRALNKNINIKHEEMQLASFELNFKIKSIRLFASFQKNVLRKC